MKYMFGAFVSLMLCAAGCSADPPDTPQIGHVSSLLASGPALSNRFEFPIHGATKESNVDTYLSFSGEGDSIIQYKNLGEVVAWSAPHTPQMQRGWPTSESEHEGLARQYFARVGVPSDEIASVTNFKGFSSLAPIADPRSVSTTPIGYSTTARRSIRGVSVPDSHAGVQLNVDRVPVSLSLSWPIVPAGILNRASTMRAALPTAWRPPAALIGSTTFVRSEVVIRHSRKSQGTTTWLVVVRSHMKSGTRATTLDTDELGNRVTEFDPPTPAQPARTK